VKTFRLPVWTRRVSLVALLLAFAASRLLAAGEEPTPLDEYVAAPDPAYKYDLISKHVEDGLTTYVLEMSRSGSTG
jgi:hypothetical protein